MKHVFKPTLVAVLFTLAIIPVLGQRKIYLKIDPKQPDSLTCRGITTCMDSVNNTISWEIADTGITSFEIVAKISNRPHPFTEHPRKKHSKKLELQLHPKILHPQIPGMIEWGYFIVWKTSTTDKGRWCDPKIAVKPSSFLP